MIFRITGLLTLIVIVLGSDFSVAQENTQHRDQEIAALQEKFETVREEFRNAVMDVQQLGFRYMNAPNLDEAFPHFDKFEQKVVDGNAILERLKPIGLELFNKLMDRGENVDDELVYFISKLTEDSFNKSQYALSYSLAEKLVRNNADNKFAEIYMARTGILTNRFGEDIALLIKANKDHFSKEDVVTNPELILINNIYLLEDLFKKEQKIREKEAQADNNPMVLLQTNKGDIEIELFEDDAPDTVGNIVNLVEKQHYDGLLFHAVIDKTAAETGIFDKDFKPRPLDYKVYDEDRKRNVFAGSIVHISPKRHSGDARFFIALAPLPNVSGTQTVIGRVKTGMDVAYALNKTHKLEESEAVPIEDVTPDRIITAKVLRKRDHEYSPRKVETENEE